MTVSKGDYIKGFEYFGPDNAVQLVEGWVDSVHEDSDGFRYNSQANASFGGARGTTIYSNLGPL